MSEEKMPKDKMEVLPEGEMPDEEETIVSDDAEAKRVSYKSYDDLPLMISVPEVAAALGISRAGAYDLARRRDFPKFKIGSRILVPKEWFIEWIAKQVQENADQYKDDFSPTH